VETLNVQPSVPFQAENSAVSLVDLPVTVRPNARLVEFQQWMHACSKKTRVKPTLQKVLNRQDAFLHFFLKLDGRFKRRVGLELNNVQLKLLTERERRLLDKVDNTTMKTPYDLVDDGQRR
jgi:hypothetical protein